MLGPGMELSVSAWSLCKLALVPPKGAWFASKSSRGTGIRSSPCALAAICDQRTWFRHSSQILLIGPVGFMTDHGHGRDASRASWLPLSKRGAQLWQAHQVQV